MRRGCVVGCWSAGQQGWPRTDVIPADGFSPPIHHQRASSIFLTRRRRASRRFPSQASKRCPETQSRLVRVLIATLAHGVVSCHAETTAWCRCWFWSHTRGVARQSVADSQRGGSARIVTLGKDRSVRTVSHSNQHVRKWVGVLDKSVQARCGTSPFCFDIMCPTTGAAAPATPILQLQHCITLHCIRICLQQLACVVSPLSPCAECPVCLPVWPSCYPIEGIHIRQEPVPRNSGHLIFPTALSTSSCIFCHTSGRTLKGMEHKRNSM